MRLSADEIPGFFNTYGWDFEPAGEGLFRTGFVGDTGHYEVWIRVTEAWVFFTIQPFVERRAGRAHGLETLRLLLSANHEASMAKLTLDEEGDVVLTVELPCDGFAYLHFADALSALSHYADVLRPRFDEVIGLDQAEVV